MLDYITKSRHTTDDVQGEGYVIAHKNRWGSYEPVTSPFTKGVNKGIERRAVRRMIKTKDGWGYLSGFHIYATIGGALKRKHVLGRRERLVLIRVKYRGRICHGLEDGERITVVKYRTIVGEV
jgi:hypothetical protein